MRASIILFCLAAVSLWGCGRSEETAANAEPQPVAETASAAARPDTALMDKWSRSCALCHVTGNAGAPRVGDGEQWAPRLAQGMDVLLQHTLEGFNDMPPLGYCMSCERDDFVALIEFMARDSMPGSGS